MFACVGIDNRRIQRYRQVLGDSGGVPGCQRHADRPESGQAGVGSRRGRARLPAQRLEPAHRVRGPGRHPGLRPGGAGLRRPGEQEWALLHAGQLRRNRSVRQDRGHHHGYDQAHGGFEFDGELLLHKGRRAGDEAGQGGENRSRFVASCLSR